MIGQHEIVNLYNKLYICARNYIWNYYQVETLADLEIAIYKACPNIVEIRSALTRFYLACLDVIREDEEFKKAYEALNELLDSDDQIYTMLNKVGEVLK
jgi:hypothetical protein